MTGILYKNDEPGAYPNSYYAATATPFAPFPMLAGDHRCDVCIIGAGYSGLSAALHLRQRGMDVILIDAHRVGWGASGRNGGQLGTGQRLEQSTLKDMVGIDDARALWSIAEDAKALVHQLIDDHKIACDYRSGIIEANHKRSYTPETKAYIDELNNDYGYDAARYVPRDEMRSIVDSSAYYDGVYDAGAGHLHPLKLSFGLVEACMEAGVSIFEKTQALATNPGTPVAIKTSNGDIRANHLIIAANGYHDGLDKRTADRVIPINNYIIATEPLDDALAASLITNGAAVADSKYVVNYFRLSSDNRLLFGGRESYRYKFPSDIKGYVRGAMLSIYPQLREARIDYGWGGTLGVTMNRMPYFDWLAPNMITIGGYSGHGVALATMGGALASEAIAGVAERFDVMARMPTPAFPGGYHARLPLLALGMAYYSLRDRLPF